MKKHKPMGKGSGINPGRVVWVHAPEVLNWKPENKYWWSLDNYNQEVANKMVKTALNGLVDTDSTKDAWNKIFKYHNQLFGLDHNYLPGQKLAIKVNMNGSGEFADDYSGNSMMSYTNPVLLKALLSSLVNGAGIKPEDITVFDAARIFPDYFADYCSENELKGIHFQGRNESKPDLEKPIVWSRDFSDKPSYYPTCLTQADYLINLANLKGHFWGVTLLAKNHYGTIINPDRFQPPVYAKLHQFVLSQNYNEYSALTDILLNYQMGEKAILNGFDAIVSTQTEGTNITNENSKWLMSPFNGDQTKSFFVSQDPIALDSVGIDFLTNEPAIINSNSSPVNRKVDNYLHEAALSDFSPSGTIYFNGNGYSSKVKGVHEHWNNSKDKEYSRNLGEKEGIELKYIKI